MQSALRFSSAELVRCIKIFSDNQHEHTGRDRQRISGLIQRHIVSIDVQAQVLIKLKQNLLDIEIAPDTWEQFTSLAHFSQTQKNRLRTLLRYLLNRDNSDEALLRELKNQSSAGAILQSLETMRSQDSRQL